MTGRLSAINYGGSLTESTRYVPNMVSGQLYDTVTGAPLYDATTGAPLYVEEPA